jgi:hypothetical protein
MDDIRSDTFRPKLVVEHQIWTLGLPDATA